LLLGWFCLNYFQLVKNVFLPPIPDVVQSLIVLFRDEGYSSDLFISTYRVMGAFLLSAALAIPIGLYTGFSERMAKITEPFVGFARYLPVPAFVPLCILWFGLDDMGKIAIIFLGTFFQLILMIVDVAREVPKTYFEAALTLGIKKTGLFFRVLLPASMPGIINSCRIAVGWAWTYLVVAEIAGATSGLGYRIMEAQRFIQTPKIFAGIIVIGILGVATDFLFKALYRYLFPWNESNK
ncbi:MAG: ABC transporter permease, partial [Nitrospinae bacterium]|nr:ABC transporter permease [Nitrospinota bacterium]